MTREAAGTPVETRTIDTPTHGRYLVRVPREPGPWPVLVGFHGYRENAPSNLAAMETMPGAERWLLVAVQALHRFYEKGGSVVASWMTKEDRELAIADNIGYVRRVVDAVGAEFQSRRPLVFFGFSQGVAMAFRAAANIPSDLLIVVGGDVPPEIVNSPPGSLPPVVYGHGRQDQLYTAEYHEHDLERLRILNTQVESVHFEGGHELTPEFMAAVGSRLSALESCGPR